MQSKYHHTDAKMRCHGNNHPKSGEHGADNSQSGDEHEEKMGRKQEK